MKYLNPKADLTFVRVFGEHPDLIISLLNSLLPLADDEQITSIEYLPEELAPQSPLKEFSIINVRCRDQKGRQFIVEMQMLWTNAFMQRVLFNAAKVYVQQLDESYDYDTLQPVYSLALLNLNYIKDSDDYYHLYRFVYDQDTKQEIKGLRFVFIELPKFTPHTITEKKMTALWLRFLTEINEKTVEAPAELLANQEVSKALTTVEISAYNPRQLAGYEKCWDNVRTVVTLMNSARREGIEQGRALGRAQGRAEGLAQVRAEVRAQGETGVKQNIARQMKQDGMPYETITKYTGLGKEEIDRL